MDDLIYTAKWKSENPKLVEAYEDGYLWFKIGAQLKAARERARMTQEEVAQKLGTHKSAISRIENHAEIITLSTLRKYAKALGKKVNLEIV